MRGFAQDSAIFAPRLATYMACTAPPGLPLSKKKQLPYLKLQFWGADFGGTGLCCVYETIQYVMAK